MSNDVQTISAIRTASGFGSGPFPLSLGMPLSIKYSPSERRFPCCRGLRPMR
jgi:hypothetical protein